MGERGCEGIYTNKIPVVLFGTREYAFNIKTRFQGCTNYLLNKNDYKGNKALFELYLLKIGTTLEIWS